MFTNSLMRLYYLFSKAWKFVISVSCVCMHRPGKKWWLPMQ